MPDHVDRLDLSGLAQILALNAMRGAEQVFEEILCPLPDEPSRLERQMNMLRGQFAGSSGSMQESSIERSLRPFTV